MNIIIDAIIYSLQKSGGISRYFTQLLLEIIKLDPKIKTELLFSKKIINKPPKLKRIKNIFLKESKFIFFNNSKSKQQEYLTAKKSGVYHSSFYNTYPNLKIPQVVTAYDMIFEKFPQFYKQPSSLKFIKQKKKALFEAQAIIAISQTVKKEIIRFYPKLQRKIKVIYLGVSPVFKKEKNKQSKKNFLRHFSLPDNFFLYIGRRERYKNFLLLTKMLTHFKKSKINLVIVGGRALSKEEENLFKKLHLTSNIYYLEMPTDQQLCLLYNCCQALINPSLEEGFGLTILEAMACQTPVILSDIPVFKEIASQAGWYFNPLKIQTLNKLLEDFFKKNKLKEKKIRLGLKIAKRFTWRKTAKKTLALYKKLIKANA